jgi:hypothetical protein
MKRIGCIFALSLCPVSAVLAAPPLPAYKIDIHQTSVSGVSSGGAMAVQMDVAHSSIMRGVGVIAGVAYGCADPRQLLAGLGGRVARGLDCMDGGVSFGGSVGADFSVKRTNEAAGAIDPATNLARQKIWLFSGYNDGLVRRGAMDAVAGYYGHYVDPVNPGNVFYKTNNHAPHALVTAGYGGKCLGSNTKYINNCNYDAARHLLEHIYGSLNPPSNSSSSSAMLAFDQREFVDAVDPALVGLADTGHVYVPTTCKTATCRVHVVFHGCKQYEGKVHNAVYAHAGYNRWAATNKIIVLYPQTVANAALNPDGCWDWWGFSEALPNANFARKTGHQISAIKKMLDRLAEGFVSGGGSSDTFGTPQNFSVSDSSATSVAMIWQPNSAAAGFNIYRSPSSNGQFMKINGNNLVSGASFVDRGLTPNTTYYYKIGAVNGSSVEKVVTDPVSGATASEPPACDPYFSDNATHVLKDRAKLVGLTKAKARGSNDPMGLLTGSKELIQVQPDFYHARYCP